ncbi:hypothetical protein MUB04_15590 [Acinetobacter indicus]|uniref:hypothetical protein n=1 Tax=Acinetobacter TaxID=469 RepID=UPI0015D42003|nr:MULTISPECIES: hypothetical protein [Acinetobacter]MCP0917960.1 hypothetical protein [Acinetobacter indicus]
MKTQGKTLSLRTRAQTSNSNRAFAHSLNKSNAPSYPLYTPSYIATDSAVPSVASLPKFTADLSNTPQSLDAIVLNLDNVLENIDFLPDARPVQFLRNHLIKSRRYGLKFDGIGSIQPMPSDSMVYEINYDILEDAQSYHESFKPVSIKYNPDQTFEFIGSEVFCCATGIKVAQEDTFAALIEPKPTTLKVYRTVEEVPVFVLSQDGCFDKVFFDAGNNISVYLNFLFTSPDMAGKTELAREVALKLIEEEVWAFSETPLQFLNPQVTSYENLIHTYIAKHLDYTVEPENLFYFVQQGNVKYLFIAEIIAEKFDHDFSEATKFNSSTPLKPLHSNYVDQITYHIYENVYAVLTHTFNRQTDTGWNESINFLASESMVDILQAIQDQDLRDQFMIYLREFKVQSRFVVKRTDEADLEFTGSLIGFASNRKFPEHQEEGQAEPNAPTTRWTVLSLYLTKGGSYVCNQVKYSINPGEYDKVDTLVTKDKNEVSNFFGYRWLAKKLYESANFNANEIID